MTDSITKTACCLLVKTHCCLKGSLETGQLIQHTAQGPDVTLLVISVHTKESYAAKLSNVPATDRLSIVRLR